MLKTYNKHVPKTKLIPQEDALGCGFACVAVVLGITYKSAAKRLPDIYKIAQQTGLWCKDIVLALKKSGKPAYFEKITHKNIAQIEKLGTIIYTKDGPSDLIGHYLVKVREGWHNCWINWPSMKPVKAGIQKTFSGKPLYAVFLD